MARTKSAIYGPALVASGPATIFTPGAAELIEVQMFHLSNPTGSAVSVTLSKGADAAGTRFFGTNTVANVPANSTVQVIGPFYFPAGVICQASAGTNNVVTIDVEGIRHTIG